MPSLMPGMPGTKEVYGISVIREYLRIKIPPKAFERYGLTNGGLVVLTTTHKGEGGFALLNKKRTEAAVFERYISQMSEIDTVYWFNDKAYVLTQVSGGELCLTPEILEAFHLRENDNLMVVKSTTVAMSYTPIEIWKEKFTKRGLYEAIENMSKLEEF
ncbi:MAG: hypothetical protein A7316_00725 [Candidatus Altiarchaeales archaeon WOR_SM1_86-2]|nr:MAG: hypothetical protein A7315_05355 [Candidatus Altiarchaeales archaeon WOR_SM1_79]ODS39032.1 MAG: hypothetical protein A7316_00725 [Candidatus Altiarchaeales archaeon WOR_SM1_86-2]